jgi:pimeloyl-ACP methyl ester carboxylesterase
MNSGRRVRGAAALLLLASAGTVIAPAAVASPGRNISASSAPACANDFGTKVPVVLVHGFHEETDVWKPLTKSIQQDLPDAVVTLFDYPGTQWVTGPDVAPKLADLISCLAGDSTGNGGLGKVIIVAHSMGGLAVRCAVSAACAGPAAAKPTQVGLEITLGTPNTGSLLATTGNGLSDIGQFSCKTVLAIEPGLAALPCPDLLGWLFGAKTPAALALESGVNGNPSHAIASLPALSSKVPLDAIAGQVTVTTSLFQLGPFSIAGPQLGDLGDLVVSEASALDGAPPTSPPHPGSSAQHPGPGSGAVTVPCGTISVATLIGVGPSLGAVAPDVTCWHETETTDDRWQGDIITAIKTSLAAGQVTASLPVVSCPTSLGIDQPAVPLPPSRTVTVPQALAADLSVYGDTQGIMELLGPKGWNCSAFYGVDGSGGVTIYPPAEGASSPQAEITASQTSACAGCALFQACPLFPSAAEALRSDLGQACPARPAGETVTPIAAGIVSFEDPPGVKGDGHPSGGQYPANGVMTYYPSAPDGSWLETCTLPASEKDVCTAALNTFVSWYGQR